MRNKVAKKLLSVILVASMAVGLAACGNAGEETQGGADAAENTENVEAESDTEESDSAESEASEGETAAAGEADFSILEGKTIAFMTSQAKYFEAYQTMADAIEADYGCTVEFQVIPDD